MEPTSNNQLVKNQQIPMTIRVTCLDGHPALPNTYYVPHVGHVGWSDRTCHGPRLEEYSFLE